MRTAVEQGRLAEDELAHYLRLLAEEEANAPSKAAALPPSRKDVRQNGPSSGAGKAGAAGALETTT